MSQATNPLERAGAFLSEWATCVQERGDVLVCADEATRSLAVPKLGDFSATEPVSPAVGQSDSYTLDSPTLCQIEDAMGATGSNEIPALTKDSFGQLLTQFNQELRAAEAALQDPALSPQEAVEKSLGHLISAGESFQKVQESHACSPNLAKRLGGMREKIQKFAEENGVWKEESLVETTSSQAKLIEELISEIPMEIPIQQKAWLPKSPQIEKPIKLKPLPQTPSGVDTNGERMTTMRVGEVDVGRMEEIAGEVIREKLIEGGAPLPTLPPSGVEMNGERLNAVKEGPDIRLP